MAVTPTSEWRCPSRPPASASVLRAPPRRAWLLLLLIVFLSPELFTDHRTGCDGGSCCTPTTSECDAPRDVVPSSRSGTALTQPSVLPHLLFAAAAPAKRHGERATRRRKAAAKQRHKKVDYDLGLKPMLKPWHEVRHALREAQCFSTRVLPRLVEATVSDPPSAATASPLQHSTEDARESFTRLVNRTDSSTSPLTISPLCRRPIVLLSGRSDNCASCQHFAKEVLGAFRAEWTYIQSHVTLVDAGDPMSDQLVRFPYPLWFEAAEVRRLLTLTPRRGTLEETSTPRKHQERVQADRDASPNDFGVDTDISGEAARNSSTVFAFPSADAASDYHLFNAALRRKAALELQAPTSQAGHRWSKLVKRTFAFPKEYVLRIVFMYPHNGSVMRDVVNEGIFEGSSPDYLHFFTSAPPFFRAVKKAARVMDWLQRYGDY